MVVREPLSLRPQPAPRGPWGAGAGGKGLTSTFYTGGSAAAEKSDATFTNDFVTFWNYFLNHVLFFIGNSVTRFKSSLRKAQTDDPPTLPPPLPTPPENRPLPVPLPPLLRGSLPDSSLLHIRASEVHLPSSPIFA